MIGDEGSRGRASAPFSAGAAASSNAIKNVGANLMGLSFSSVRQRVIVVQQNKNAGLDRLQSFTSCRVPWMIGMSLEAESPGLRLPFPYQMAKGE
jgi:hypothetical protein